MRRVPENILSKIPPDNVRAFLRGRGFTEKKSKREGWHILLDGNRKYLVPNDMSLWGYSDTIVGIIESFVSENESFDEILYQIFEPNCELMTHRLADETSRWGTATLGSVMNVVEGYYGVVKENARHVARRILASNVPERSNHYTNSCRMGQTDYGSFILRFILPSGQPVMDSENNPMTFGFQVLSQIENIFSFIATEVCIEVEAQQEKPPSLNRKVLECMTKITPVTSLGSECEIIFRHANSMRKYLSDNKPVSVTKMDSLYFDRVEILRQQYARSESFQRETYKCYITDLHKDSPADTPPQGHTQDDWSPPPKKHKITVELRTGTTRRKLRLILFPTQYHSAIQWHDAEVPLLIDATIDKRTSNWSVSELHDFKPYGEQEKNLFSPT